MVETEILEKSLYSILLSLISTSKLTSILGIWRHLQLRLRCPWIYHDGKIHISVVLSLLSIDNIL